MVIYFQSVKYPILVRLHGRMHVSSIAPFPVGLAKNPNRENNISVYPVAVSYRFHCQIIRPFSVFFCQGAFVSPIPCPVRRYVPIGPGQDDTKKVTAHHITQASTASPKASTSAMDNRAADCNAFLIVFSGLYCKYIPPYLQLFAFLPLPGFCRDSEQRGMGCLPLPERFGFQAAAIRSYSLPLPRLPLPNASYFLTVKYKGYTVRRFGNGKVFICKPDT